MEQQQRQPQRPRNTRESDTGDGAPAARGLDADDLVNEIDRTIDDSLPTNAEQFLRRSRQGPGQ